MRGFKKGSASEAKVKSDPRIGEARTRKVSPPEVERPSIGHRESDTFLPKHPEPQVVGKAPSSSPSEVRLPDSFKVDLYPKSPEWLDPSWLGIVSSQPYFFARRTSAGIQVSGQNDYSWLEPVDGNSESNRTGMFAQWKWDGQELVVKNDELGFKALFVAVDDKQACVSTHLGTLLELGVSREIDWDAMAVFLRLGYFVGEQTPFKAIRCLRPSSTVRWSPEKWSVEVAPTELKRVQGSRLECQHEVIRLFSAAISRRSFEGRFVLPMSGGRDSRMIFFELLKQGIRPEFNVTSEHFPPRPNQDMEVAKTISKRAGVQHVAVRQQGSRFKKEFRNHYLTSFCADEGAWTHSMCDMLGESCDILADGIAGDSQMGHFSNEAWYEAMDQGEFRKQADLFLTLSCDESKLRRTISPELYQKIPRDAALAAVEKEVAYYRNHLDPVQAFFLFNRTRREVALAPFSILESQFKVQTPFLDLQLHRFLAAMPKEAFLGKTFQIDTVNLAHPQYADIPLDKTIKRRNRTFSLAGCQYARDLKQLVGGNSAELFEKDEVSKILRNLTVMSAGRFTNVGKGIVLGPMMQFLSQIDQLSPLL